jgi:hypothetical protein
MVVPGLVLFSSRCKNRTCSQGRFPYQFTQGNYSLFYLPCNALWPLRTTKGLQRPTDCRCPPSCVCLVLTYPPTWTSACPKQRLGSQDRIRTCNFRRYLFGSPYCVYHSATWLKKVNLTIPFVYSICHYTLMYFMHSSASTQLWQLHQALLFSSQDRIRTCMKFTPLRDLHPPRWGFL